MPHQLTETLSNSEPPLSSLQNETAGLSTAVRHRLQRKHSAVRDYFREDVRVHFEGLTDPRRGEPTYPLLNIVVMTLSAVISGADDFVAIARWSTKNVAWLARYLDLSEGIPSPDHFNAIFAAMNSREFEMCLLNWITSLHEITAGQVITIDGKTLRRSYDALSSKSAIHMVSAWATMNHISLGQVVVDAKSNEITAIPKLLDLIDVSGGMVTIDAMGCQTEILEKIVEKKADACRGEAESTEAV
jgi:hypothetical protein